MSEAERERYRDEKIFRQQLLIEVRQIKDLLVVMQSDVADMKQRLANIENSKLYNTMDRT